MLESIMLEGAAACAAALTLDGPAMPRPPVQITAELTLVSDYRRGGVTRSDNNPALQGRVDIKQHSGWSAGAFASSIDSRRGSNAELDLYGAKRVDFGDTQISLGTTAIFFFGGDADPFATAQASVSHPMGPIDATLAVNYAPRQQALNDESGLSINLRARTPLGRIAGAPLTASASIGRSQGEFAMGAKVKLDWSVAVTTEIGGAEIGLAYVDNDLDGKRGDGAMVFSIGHKF